MEKKNPDLRRRTGRNSLNYSQTNDGSVLIGCLIVNYGSLYETTISIYAWHISIKITVFVIKQTSNRSNSNWQQQRQPEMATTTITTATAATNVSVLAQKWKTK